MTTAPPVKLRRVRLAERPELDPLIDEHLAEAMKFRETQAGPTSSQDYEELALFWQERGRHPFFLTMGSERVGLALVREVLDEAVIEMAEFYVFPKHRRNGVGRAAMLKLWQRFPGSWRFQVNASNEGGRAFWPLCLEAHGATNLDVKDITAPDGARVEYTFDIPSMD